MISGLPKPGHAPQCCIGSLPNRTLPICWSLSLSTAGSGSTKPCLRRINSISSGFPVKNSQPGFAFIARACLPSTAGRVLGRLERDGIHKYILTYHVAKHLLRLCQVPGDTGANAVAGGVHEIDRHDLVLYQVVVKSDLFPFMGSKLHIREKFVPQPFPRSRIIFFTRSSLLSIRAGASLWVCAIEVPVSARPADAAPTSEKKSLLFTLVIFFLL